MRRSALRACGGHVWRELANAVGAAKVVDRCELANAVGAAELATHSKLDTSQLFLLSVRQSLELGVPPHRWREGEIRDGLGRLRRHRHLGGLLALRSTGSDTSAHGACSNCDGVGEATVAGGEGGVGLEMA